MKTCKIPTLLFLLAAGPVSALPSNPKACIGARMDGTLILAGDPLHGKDFSRALFLDGADLMDADFSGSDLTGALFFNANLARATFLGATLDGVGWTDSFFLETVMADGTPRTSAARAVAGAAPAAAAAPPAAPDARQKTIELLAKMALAEDREDAFTAFVNAQDKLSFLFEPDLPLGALRELTLGEAKVQRLAPTPVGLVATVPGSRFARVLTPHGCTLQELTGEPDDFGAAEDRLWYSALGRTRFMALRIRPNPNCPSEYMVTRAGKSIEPASAEVRTDCVAGTPGSIWLLTKNHLFQFPGPRFEAQDAKGGGKDAPEASLGHHLLSQATGYKSLRPGPKESVSFAGGTHLGLVRADAGAKARVLEGQSLDGKEVHATLLAGDGSLYYLCKGSDSLYRARFDDKGVPSQEALPLGLAKAGLNDLAEGPGGAIWCTALAGNALLRFDPGTGQTASFPLPRPHMAPAQIVRGPGDKMFFSQAGSGRIGAITALAPARGGDRKAAAEQVPAWGEPAPAVATAPAPAAPPKDHKGAPGAAAAAPAASAAGSGGAAAATAAAGSAQPSPGDQVPASARPAPVKPGAPPPAEPHPDAKGAAASAPIRPGVWWAHIEQGHWYGLKNTKGQFLKAHSNRQKLSALLDAAVGAPTYPHIQDADGCYLAMRTFDADIGRVHDSRGWANTRNLLVVLLPDRKTVKTAYPVKDFRTI